MLGLGPAVLGLSWFLWQQPTSTSTAAPAKDQLSNIHPDDYVGPEVCGECHEEQHQGWKNGLHRTMNSLGEETVGDFSGVELSYAGGRARFYREGGQHLMALTSADGSERIFRVTRTIGSRYLQEYVGVEVTGDADGRTPEDAQEIRLPFGYWLRPRAWLHRQYFDSWYRAEYTEDGKLSLDPYRPDDEPWAERCAWCHNTYPFDVRMIRADARLVGQGREQYYRLLRSSRSAAERSAIAEHNRLPVDQLVTVGISCESCHLGGRAHAEDGADISFVPVSRDIERLAYAPALDGGRKNGLVINSLCAQCHSTPSPRYPGGGAMRNSSEALDMASGACMSQIRCTDCHDPHRRGAGAGAPIEPAHERACARCHQDIAAAGTEHSRHEGVSCLDCHMPRIVKGVTEAVRSHRIARPVEAAMVTGEHANACNLCHLDRSLPWTLAALEEHWGHSLELPDPVLERYGETPVGRVWLSASERNTRAIAASAYSRSTRGQETLAELIDIVDDDIAFYRMWNLFALEDLLGRPLGKDEFDPMAPPGQRWQPGAIDRLLDIRPPGSDGRPEQR